jgi:cytochrome c553
MRVAVRVTGLAVAAAGLVAAAIGWQPRGVQAQGASGPAPNTVEFYNQRVQPILSNNCYRCHGGENHRGHLHMDTRAELLAGGHDGVVIVPGHPEQSLLVKLIRHEGPEDDPMPMPPKSKLSDADIATISEWIKAGAVMP